MAEYNESLPNPNILTGDIRSGEEKKEGRLKIYFGYAAGVGKTYAMLEAAGEMYDKGVDIIAGYVDTHARPETVRLLERLPVLPQRQAAYKTLKLSEFDLDAALKRRPELILVDELAHTNLENSGVRNKKRYQDIEELLKAGIDVWTTVNVQHIESLNDVIHDITNVEVKETVPDYIFDNADMVKLVDIEPEELLRRLREDQPDKAETEPGIIITLDNLRLLREIATRKAADRLSRSNQIEVKATDRIANSKLLVCIGPSPSSAKCIRWTARMAGAFHVPWVAVYVENLDSGYLSEGESKNVKENIDLAEQLGAEIVTLSGEGIAPAVAEYSKLSGITDIVLGKSRNRKSLKTLFADDLEDKIMKLLPNAEVHIVPGSPTMKSYHKPHIRSLKPNIMLSIPDTLKSIGCLATATLVCFVLRAFGIGNQNFALMYILSVLIVSRMTSGYIYGIAVSILSVLVFNFFFTEPYYTFAAIQPGYPLTFFIMLIVALITTGLTYRVKTQAKLALEREKRTEVLFEVSKRLLTARGLDNIAALTNEYTEKIFGRSVIFYTKDPADGANGILTQSPIDKNAAFMSAEDERAVAHWVFINQKNAGAGTDTLAGARAFYMPILSQGKVLGVIGLSCAKGKLSISSRLFLQMIISQVALALDRQILSDEQRRIIIESEKEKMRSNLLRAISHDLRTPLTCISGAVSVILENGSSIDKETHDRFLANIRDDSQWLIRMVENILSVTRISEGMASVAKVPEAAEEIVGEAVSRIRKRFPDRKITVKVPDELLMVPMDGTLIEQVILNLLENAIKHSGEDSVISLTVSKEGDEAVFEVGDNGEGITEQDLPFVFESYAPNRKKSSDSSRGMGIGLSICMSIIKAHQGKLEAANKKEGGAIFRFTLPVQKNEQKELG